MDPLAGHRQAINEGRCESILRPDTGQPCPFKTGEEFKLRSCRIVIRKTHRIKRDRKPYWRAEFDRYVPDRLYILARGAGDGRGYASDPNLAQRAQDPIPEERSEGPSAAEQEAGVVGGNDREPPEPEAVPPHEIANYSHSKLSRERYDHEMEEARARERELPLGERMASAVRRAKEQHVDVNGDLKVIEQRVEKIERKLSKRG